MNLYVCLNIWCDHINSLVVIGKSKYQGKAVKGFKDGKKTKVAYSFLKQHMINNGKTNFELDVDNMEATLFYLFQNTQPEEYSSTTYHFLQTIISSEKRISKNVNENQMNILRNQFELAKTTFDELIVEEAFDDNETNIVNDTMSQNENNSNHASATANVTTTNINISNEQTNNSLSQQLLHLENMFKSKFDEINKRFDSFNCKDSNYESKTYQQLSKLLGFRIRKLLLVKHHIKIQQQHLTNKTAPMQLQVNHFFTPFSYTTKFLTKMDEILGESQIKIINSVIEENRDKEQLIMDDIEK